MIAARAHRPSRGTLRLGSLAAGVLCVLGCHRAHRDAAKPQTSVAGTVTLRRDDAAPVTLPLGSLAHGKPLADFLPGHPPDTWLLVEAQAGKAGHLRLPTPSRTYPHNELRLYRYGDGHAALGLFPSSSAGTAPVPPKPVLMLVDVDAIEVRTHAAAPAAEQPVAQLVIDGVAKPLFAHNFAGLPKHQRPDLPAKTARKPGSGGHRGGGGGAAEGRGSVPWATLGDLVAQQHAGEARAVDLAEGNVHLVHITGHELGDPNHLFLLKVNHRHQLRYTSWVKSKQAWHALDELESVTRITVYPDAAGHPAR